MEAFNGVIINKVNGGLVRESGASDRVILLVCAGKAVAGLPNYSPVALDSIEALEQMGVTSATDIADKELLHYHCEEVFRLSPEREMYLITVPAASKVSELMTSDNFLSAVRAVEGVNTIGLAGMAADESIETAVKAVQAMVDAMREDHHYIDCVILEGLSSYLPTIAGATDLRSLECENVSVVVAQDKDVADKDAAFSGHAAVGAALGMLSVRYVHENMGSVDIENHPRTAKGTPDYSMMDKTTGKWVNVSLSNGNLLTSVSRSDQKTLNEKGYIYAGTFEGYTGVFFSNSHTCTEKTSDYAYIEFNSVWNKAAKIIRNTLIPRVRGIVKADPSTGYIATETISYWDSLIRKALDGMVASDDISGYDIYINPSQKAVSDKPFQVQAKMVANGVVHAFEIDLGFTNKID